MNIINMNRIICICLLLMLNGCSENSDKIVITKDPVIKTNRSCAYDTLLKGNYQIFCMTDDSLMHLLLKKDSIIKEIASATADTSEKNLGFVKADFPEHFVLVHSFDPGTSDFAELIEKKTGDVILSGFYIDADTEKEFFLYGQVDPSSMEDNMVLYNIKTKVKNTLEYPKEITAIPVEKAIQIDQVSANTLRISFNTPKGKKTKDFKF
jgi:hypothetical protein